MHLAPPKVQGRRGERGQGSLPDGAISSPKIGIGHPMIPGRAPHRDVLGDMFEILKGAPLPRDQGWVGPNRH